MRAFKSNLLMTPFLQQDSSRIHAEADRDPRQDQKQDANGNEVSLPLQHRGTTMGTGGYRSWS